MLKNYQQFQKKTSKKDWDLLYLSVGLGGEVGEVLNEIKKIKRDDDGFLTPKRKINIVNELGDVMWYLTGIATKLDIKLEDILLTNIDKINK